MNGYFKFKSFRSTINQGTRSNLFCPPWQTKLLKSLDKCTLCSTDYTQELTKLSDYSDWERHTHFEPSG